MVGGNLGEQFGRGEGGRGGVDLEAGRAEEGEALGGDWIALVGGLSFGRRTRGIVSWELWCSRDT